MIMKDRRNGDDFFVLLIFISLSTIIKMSLFSIHFPNHLAKTFEAKDLFQPEDPTGRQMQSNRQLWPLSMTSIMEVLNWPSGKGLKVWQGILMNVK